MSDSGANIAPKVFNGCALTFILNGATENVISSLTESDS